MFCQYYGHSCLGYMKKIRTRVGAGGQGGYGVRCPLPPQEEYYATHQCFLTSRSLYLLVWNVVDGLVGLRPWLENIEVRYHVM